MQQTALDDGRFPLRQDRWTLLCLQLKAEVFVSFEPISMRRKVQSAVEIQQQELPNPPASNCTLSKDTKPWPTQTVYQPQEHVVSFHCLRVVSWKQVHLPMWKPGEATHVVVWKTADTSLVKLASDLPGIERRVGASRSQMRKTAVMKLCPIAKANSSICMTFASVITFHWVLYTDRDLITL